MRASRRANMRVAAPAEAARERTNERRFLIPNVGLSAARALADRRTNQLAWPSELELSRELELGAANIWQAWPKRRGHSSAKRPRRFELTLIRLSSERRPSRPQVSQHGRRWHARASTLGNARPRWPATLRAPGDGRRWFPLHRAARLPARRNNPAAARPGQRPIDLFPIKLSFAHLGSAGSTTGLPVSRRRAASEERAWRNKASLGRARSRLLSLEFS